MAVCILLGSQIPYLSPSKQCHTVYLIGSICHCLCMACVQDSACDDDQHSSAVVSACISAFSQVAAHVAYCCSFLTILLFVMQKHFQLYDVSHVILHSVHARMHARTHTHTHTHPFNGPLPGTIMMPLPLTVSCFSKIQMVLPFWYRLTRVVLEKGPLNGCVCVVRDYPGGPVPER